MALDDPIEVDLDQGRIEASIRELKALIVESPKEAQLRMIKELAEELSKHYNIELKIKQRKQFEILSKKITINLVPTPNLIKWLIF